jgi:hypothetical protein
MNVVNSASKSGNLVKENENPPPGPVGPPPGGLKGTFNVSVPSWTSWRVLDDVGGRLIGGFRF